MNLTLLDITNENDDSNNIALPTEKEFFTDFTQPLDWDDIIYLKTENYC